MESGTDNQSDFRESDPRKKFFTTSSNRLQEKEAQILGTNAFWATFGSTFLIQSGTICVLLDLEKLALERKCVRP